MKIAVSAGHNVYIRNNFDCGSVGSGLREADITKETVRLLIPMLKSMGHTVLDVTPYDQNFNHSRDAHVVRCKKADDFGADLLIDVHVNASTGKGTGVECWVYSTSSKSFPYATRICGSISSLGLSNRGVKINSGYWTVALGTTPAIIVEGAFIDNANDMKILTPLKYATSIAEGVTGQKPKEENANMIKEEVVKTVNEVIKPSINNKGMGENHWAHKEFKELNEFLKANDVGVIHDTKFNDRATRGEVMTIVNLVRKGILNSIK